MLSFFSQRYFCLYTVFCLLLYVSSTLTSFFVCVLYPLSTLTNCFTKDPPIHIMPVFVCVYCVSSLLKSLLAPKYYLHFSPSRCYRVTFLSFVGHWYTPVSYWILNIQLCHLLIYGLFLFFFRTVRCLSPSFPFSCSPPQSREEGENTESAHVWKNFRKKFGPDILHGTSRERLTLWRHRTTGTQTLKYTF